MVIVGTEQMSAKRSDLNVKREILPLVYLSLPVYLSSYCLE